MSRNRTAAILVACTALLCPYSASAAAPSRLEPMPPVALPHQAPTSPSREPPGAGTVQSSGAASTRTTTTIRAATSTAKPTALPRTGVDLPLQALLAAALLLAGVTLRTRLGARPGRR
ncbi:MAG: hypothetical protein ACR2IP_10205 [Solirubrobacteraceae bacterium]